jgi:outer membrane receptor protein involved in Fe transport
MCRLPQFRAPAPSVAPVALLVATLGLATVLARAQPIPSASYPADARSIARMSLGELLRQRVTVASLTEESFVEAPSSVTVFTREEIMNMGVRTVEALLNFVPGMQSTRAGGLTTYSLGTRGRNPSQLANNTLILINGQRLNEELTGSALVFDRFLSTGNVARVEVIRGPGSALYGANAFLSVVNIVTADDLNGVLGGLGSFQGREGYVNLSAHSVRAGGALFVHGFADDGDSFPDPTDPAGGTVRDPRSGFNAQGTVELDRLRLELRHAQFTVEDFYLFDLVPASDVNHYESRDTSINAAWEVLAAGPNLLTLSSGYRWIDGEALAFVFSAEQMQELAGRGEAAYLGGPVVEQSEWNLAADGAFALGDRHRLNAGLSFRQPRFHTLRNQNNYETVEFVDRVIFGQPVEVTYYGDVVETNDFGPSGSTREILGAYLQDRIQLAERSRLTAGLRLDHYSDFGSTLNPRIALVHAPTPGTTFKLMYGEAFRAPNITETVEEGPNGFGDPDLEPEKIRTAELAWLQNFDRFQTVVTGYYAHLEDRIVRVPAPDPDPRTTFANGGSDDLSGLELELYAEPARGLLLRGSYSHMFDIAASPNRASRDLASFIVNYARPPWNLNLNGFYHGEVEANDPAEASLADYWIMNTNLRFSLGHLTLVGGVYNVLDADARTFTEAPIAEGVPLRGRTFRVGLELNF